MKKILMFVLMGMLLLSACGKEGIDIEAHDAWVRTGLKDGNTAAYLLLHNHTEKDDALIGASSDVADVVEIHLSQISADGVMQMLRQESIALPTNGELELKPGSYHIMMIGLKQDLNAVDQISITLHFQHHEDIILSVPVMEAESMGGSGMDMHDQAAPTP